jgi:outer membrane lipoprotein-sorting protein
VSPTSNTGSDTKKTTFSTPPFSTKEPDRYQAIRITTFTETSSSENSSSAQSAKVLIARDGEKRREEYSSGSNGQIIYLHIPAGRFIVLPEQKLYADISTVSDETDPNNRSGQSSNDSPALSPDQLLNDEHAPATYEKLGTETLAGRTATKYRVVVFTGTDSQTETLIWIDEALGMPVRSEAMSNSSGYSSKVTTELRDVKLDVDERLFSWPSDYKKAEAELILDLIRKQEKPGTPKQQEK